MDAHQKKKSNQTTPEKNIKANKKDMKPNRSGVLKFKNERKNFIKDYKALKKGRGLIYLGRIPHGFYEDQMTAYFNQFGRVVSAVVPRSRKTGRSKGYGFVEFEDEEVAKIAAETMNNYLMYNKIIKCRYIPPEERRKSGFIRSTSAVKRVLTRNKNINKKRKSLTKLNLNEYQKRTQQKINEFKQFFEERGINFNFLADVKNSKDHENGDDSEKDSNTANDVMEDQFGVLEIDTSDAEIHFKIPPQVKKVIKKSNSSVITPNSSSQIGEKPKIKKPKKSNSEVEQTKSKKVEKKVKKKLSEKNKPKEKLVKKVNFNIEKTKPLKKQNQIILNQRKVRTKRVSTRKLRKEKNNLDQKLPKNDSKELSPKILSEILPKKINSVNISYYQI